MNILYIAYSCSPYHGSEDKIGWNIPLESAKKNKVFVITKEEQRQYIEKYCETHSLENIEFYYVDIPKIFKRIYRGALYSGRCNIWNQRAYHLAKRISQDRNIEIIHQITPVEFRSIGDYGKIPNVKFVCGPIGGAETIPTGLQCYALGKRYVELARKIANWWCRCKIIIAKKLQNCECLLFANRETKDYLRKTLPNSCIGCMQSEIGISGEEIIVHASAKPKFTRFLVVGRMIYRKGHQFLLDALEKLPEGAEYECVFLGDGVEYKALENRVANHRVLREKVFFAGSISYDQVEEEYMKASVLVMPSIRETTGTVVLEAMAKSLPIVTIRKFGAATILDEETGWLFIGKTRDEYVNQLKDSLLECIQNPDEVQLRGDNARKKAEQFTWDKKNEYYLEVYSKVRNLK